MAYRNLSAVDADAQVRHGRLTLVDVRPPEERAIAAVSVDYAALEGGGLEKLMALPKDTPLAFLCHHGGRSARVTQFLRANGFPHAINIRGGIDAWARELDPAMQRY